MISAAQVLGWIGVARVRMDGGKYPDILEIESGNRPITTTGCRATLARPSAPLAACVQRHPCTKTNKIWLCVCVCVCSVYTHTPRPGRRPRLTYTFR